MVQATDPLGKAQGAALGSCPPASGGVPGGTCYQLNISSCDGVADFAAYLKVNTPQGIPGGTVIFSIGKGGAGLYDSDFTFGNVAVGNVLAAGFTTVQVSFGPPFNSATPNGWLTGPGGVRRLACRYATVAQWVHDNIHAGGASKPFCAAGNSGGAGAVAYAVAHYGLDKIFSMLEVTSGPPMTRIDQACVPAAACQTMQTDCNGVPQT